MNDLYLQIFGFIVCAIVIVIRGSRLSKYGDMIADMMGWGKMFVGLILMASGASLFRRKPCSCERIGSKFFRNIVHNCSYISS